MLTKALWYMSAFTNLQRCFELRIFLLELPSQLIKSEQVCACKLRSSSAPGQLRALAAGEQPLGDAAQHDGQHVRHLGRGAALGAGAGAGLLRRRPFEQLRACDCMAQSLFLWSTEFDVEMVLLFVLVLFPV